MNQNPINPQRPNHNTDRSRIQNVPQPAAGRVPRQISARRTPVNQVNTQRSTAEFSPKVHYTQNVINNTNAAYGQAQNRPHSVQNRTEIQQHHITQNPVPRPNANMTNMPQHTANTQQSHNPNIQHNTLPAAKRRITTTGEPPVSRRTMPAHNHKSKAYLEQSYGRGSKSGSSGLPVLSSVMKAVMYIVFMFIISGFLAYYVIIVGNDVFAFVKSDEQVDVTIPEYATITDIADILKENDVIKYPSVFKLYAQIKKKAEVEFVSGNYSITPSMNYDQLIAEFRASSASRTTVSITIREGWTIDDIIDYLTGMGIGTRDGYVEIIENYNFDYWFIQELTDLPSSRIYRLEGYLFPDTYYVYTDATELSVINKMLYNFNLKFEPEWREACEALGYSVDEIITLASMIQAEGKYVTDYGNISSVFHNRLNNPKFETYGFLESDATIQYVLDERKSDLSYEDLENQNEYNTYTHKGLPPGPICNPSLNAISFALAPDETDYYYFVSNKSGTYTWYAKTFNEHVENKKLAKGE